MIVHGHALSGALSGKGVTAPTVSSRHAACHHVRAGTFGCLFVPRVYYTRDPNMDGCTGWCVENMLPS